MSLHQAIALCMDHCYSAELAGNNDWFKTIVLSGGTACLPGLAGKCPFYFGIFRLCNRAETWNGATIQKTHGDELQLRFLILLSVLYWFRTAREGTSFVPFSTYVQRDQSNTSSIWCRYSMVWCKDYWQRELSTNSEKYSHFVFSIWCYFYVDWVLILNLPIKLNLLANLLIFINYLNVSLIFSFSVRS